MTPGTIAAAAKKVAVAKALTSIFHAQVLPTTVAWRDLMKQVRNVKMPNCVVAGVCNGTRLNSLLPHIAGKLYVVRGGGVSAGRVAVTHADRINAGRIRICEIRDIPWPTVSHVHFAEPLALKTAQSLLSECPNGCHVTLGNYEYALNDPSRVFFHELIRRGVLIWHGYCASEHLAVARTLHTPYLTNRSSACFLITDSLRHLICVLRRHPSLRVGTVTSTDVKKLFDTYNGIIVPEDSVLFEAVRGNNAVQVIKPGQVLHAGSHVLQVPDVLDDASVAAVQQFLGLRMLDLHKQY